MARKFTPRVLIGLLVFSTIVGTSHLYLFRSLVHTPRWPLLLSTALSAILVAGAGLLLLLPFTLRAFSAKVTRALAWPSYLWMGAFFYLLVFTSVADLGLWLFDSQGLISAQEQAGGVIAISALVCLLGLFNALRTPPVKRVHIELSRWPRELDGYRIVQLSDIHIGSILRGAFAQRLVERCNDLKPDVVAITGDLVDGRLDDLRDHVAPFSQLSAVDGVFFATGNHDHYSGAGDWVEYLGGLGLRVLRNTHVVVERDGVEFAMGGVDDRSSRTGDDVAAAFSNAAAETARVLLAHHPETFHKARQGRVDLQLSGHTHAGQMFPFRYLVYLQTRFIDGLHRRGPHALYVSRGTGFWGPPMRVLAPAEITEIILQRAG